MAELGDTATLEQCKGLNAETGHSANTSHAADCHSMHSDLALLGRACK